MPDPQTASLLSSENIRTAMLILLFLAAAGGAFLIGRALLRWGRHNQRRRSHRKRLASERPATLHQ
jgi:hypothetical protein